jgi:hypothetical protein
MPLGSQCSGDPNRWLIEISVQKFQPVLGAGDRDGLEPAVLSFSEQRPGMRWVKWLLL